MFVAWNMGEWREFAHLRQYRMPYRITLLAVFFLTVVFDLTVAVEVGLIAACITFIYRISSLSRSVAVTASEMPALAAASGTVQAYRLHGALFFGAVKLLEEIEDQLPQQALVLDFANVIYMDSSGVDALTDLLRASRKGGVRLLISSLEHQPQDIARRSGLLAMLNAEDLQPDLQQAVESALQAPR
jgi:SulP family sulfate permease